MSGLAQPQPGHLRFPIDINRMLKSYLRISFPYESEMGRISGMITVVGGTKGGSGKSTVATNLTVMLAAAGRDVLLVDADDQETSTDFTAMRNETRPGGAGYTCVAVTGRNVLTEVKRLADKYQEVVIDTGGRDTASQRAALAICDTYLVPFAPRSFDVWTLDKVADLIEEARSINPDLRALAFINRADAQGKDNAEAAEFKPASRRWSSSRLLSSIGRPSPTPPRKGWPLWSFVA